MRMWLICQQHIGYLNPIPDETNGSVCQRLLFDACMEATPSLHPDGEIVTQCISRSPRNVEGHLNSSSVRCKPGHALLISKPSS